MIRKRLVTTFGALLIGGGGMAVEADITVFGHIDESVVAINQDGGSDETGFLECTTCSIGFRGSEDLGNGLKAIFKLDFQYDINEVTSNGAFTDRDQWLGMANSSGQVRVGTISTTYKSTGAMIDPIYRTSLQGRDRGLQSNMHTGAGSDGEGRAENTARYDSPSWNGLKVAATYTLVPDSNPSVGGQVNDDNGYGGGISYENAGILLFADYITNNSGRDDDAYKFGGKYTFNNFAVFGQYEIDGGLITSKAPDTSGDGADTWLLGGTVTLGNNMLYLGYGRADGGDLLSDYYAWELVGTHAMSKRTKFYGGYSVIDCDDQDTDVCSEVGPKAGEDEKFTLGIKHLF